MNPQRNMGIAFVVCFILAIVWPNDPMTWKISLMDYAGYIIMAGVLVGTYWESGGRVEPSLVFIGYLVCGCVGFAIILAPFALLLRFALERLT